MQDGDFCMDGGPGERGACLGELRTDLCDLGIERDGGAIRAEQGAVVLLLAVEGAAPLPVLHRLRAVADGVPGHGTDLPFVEHVVVGGPIDHAGLRFHDPEVFALEAAGKVVRCAVAHGVEVAGADVVVPRGEIEVLLDGVVVELVEPTHGVGSDDLAGFAVGADCVDLDAVVAAPSVGDELLPVEQQAGVAVGLFDGDLRPVLVGFAPVGGGPTGVQVAERAVFRFEPLLELGTGVWAVAFVADFVVELPGDHVGVVAEASRHLRGDLGDQVAVFGIGEVELLAVAVRVLAAVFHDAEGAGIGGREPCRGCRAGGAEDDGDAMLFCSADGVGEPVQLVVAFGGLHAAPGKLTDARKGDVGVLHELEVGVPAGFRPLLWIPGRAKQKGWGARLRRQRLLGAGGERKTDSGKEDAAHGGTSPVVGGV